jgi:hypothetical protein
LPMGEAIVTAGLVVRDAVSGFGLVSFGLLWERSNIWIDVDLAGPISTAWASAESAIITSWTDSDSALTTTWTDTYVGEPI